jgi:predicted dehydrogenase
MTSLIPVRFALLGGGPGSFIGAVHRTAAELDQRLKLVAGVFSRDPFKSREAGKTFGVEPERVYSDVGALVVGERSRSDAAQLVVIATPNDTHFALARTALNAGFDVISDKPVAANLHEAVKLRSIVKESGCRYGVTYGYSGYPMVREARELVRSGRLGKVRKVVVEYSQGWLACAKENEGDKQARWRTDPLQAGVGGCVADIGVHAFHLAEYVIDRQVAQICADLGRVVPGRRLDDDCNVLLRFEDGARGVLHATQIASGDRNGLRLRAWGEYGGLDWSQENPSQLLVNWLNAPSQVFHAGSAYLSEPAKRASRLPAGHPEGFIEALANLYRAYAESVENRDEPDPSLLPGIEAGVRGVAFVECAVNASRSLKWAALAAADST